MSKQLQLLDKLNLTSTIMTIQIKHQGLQGLAAIASICVGLFIISFALLSDSKGILFFPDIYKGESIESWVQSIRENAQLARIIMILPVIGFSSILVAGVTLFQLIKPSSWQKNLALASYVIGVPVVVSMMISHLSLRNYLIVLFETGGVLSDQLELQVSLQLHHWMIVNDIFGPLFVVVIGTSFMAWSALQAKFLPKWLCYWGLFNGVMMCLSFLFVVIPAFQFASFAAPLHMLWFFVLGLVLLRRERGGEN